MMEEIGLFEAMHSHMSITRYKPDPVPREAIDRVVEAATKAPSGGNTQPWHFLVITDRDLIARVGGIYREEWLGRLGAYGVQVKDSRQLPEALGHALESRRTAVVDMVIDRGPNPDTFRADMRSDGET